MRRLGVLVAAVAATALLPSAATATVPPTDCGSITAKGHRYNVRTHLVSCRRARDWSRAYLMRRQRPSGWTCRNYTDSALTFRCRRGGRDFFAIKRR